MVETNLIKLTSPLQQQVEKGISILRQGGIIAFPTDTVYGLGASMNAPRAIERIYEVKRRPLNMPLPLLVASISQITEVAETISPVAWLLIRRFLPGALTLVLPRASSVPDVVTAGGRTVAVRVPAHPVSVTLIESLGAPVVGTSANLSGRPSPLTADEVYSQLGDQIDLLIDGGECPGGRDSTIVDLTGKRPLILREGAITREELRKVCDIS